MPNKKPPLFAKENKTLILDEEDRELIIAIGRMLDRKDEVENILQRLGCEYYKDVRS